LPRRWAHRPTTTDLPRLPAPPFQRAVPITPADRDGCERRLLPHPLGPSPNSSRVGVHEFPFEACSGFTRVTARRIAQPPIGGLCHEASTRTVARPSRSSASRSTDNSLGGTFLHWCYAPSGRTAVEKVFLGRWTKFFRAAGASNACPGVGPHRLSEKRPQSFVPALPRLAVSQVVENGFFRDFLDYLIFDVFDSIEASPPPMVSTPMTELDPQRKWGVQRCSRG
jgi:hypothetical protein